MKIAGIYTITNLLTDKVYVGSSVNVARRFTQHRHLLKKGEHRNKYLQAAWNKYGEEHFEFALMERVRSKELLIAREQFWIDVLNSVKSGYNLRPDARNQLGFKHSPETKKQMSVRRKGVKHSEQTRKRIGKGQVGKVICEETRKKIGAANRGRKVSIETRMKQSASRTGLKRSPEAIQKTSQALRGRTLSEEHRAKISAGKKSFHSNHVVKQSADHVAKREAARMATVRAKQLAGLNSYKRAVQ